MLFAPLWVNNEDLHLQAVPLAGVLVVRSSGDRPPAVAPHSTGGKSPKQNGLNQTPSPILAPSPGAEHWVERYTWFWSGSAQRKSRLASCKLFVGSLKLAWPKRTRWSMGCGQGMAIARQKNDGWLVNLHGRKMIF